MPSKSGNETNSVYLGGSSFVRFFDFFFVLRPTLIFPLWTMTLAGAALSQTAGEVDMSRWIFLSLGLTSMFGLVYLLNQLKDIESDKINKKLFLIAEGALSRKSIILEASLLFVMTLVFLIIGDSVYLGIWIFVLFLIIGVLYNYSPLALKQKPWGGIFAYAAGGWMFVHVGSLVYHVDLNIFLNILHELPYVLAFVSSCLVTNLPDLAGDLEQGKKTFSVVYGKDATIIVAILGIVLAGALGILNSDWVILIPCAVSLPVFIYGFVKKDINRIIQANKLAIFALSIAVGIVFPVYLLIIILYFPFARWYHLHRFKLSYPSFR